jgi:hypothetical protein
LSEIKHKGELEVWHSKPLDHGRLLHTTIYFSPASWACRVAAPLCQYPAPPPPGPSSTWDCQIPAPPGNPTPQPPPLRPYRDPALCGMAYVDSCPVGPARPQLCIGAHGSTLQQAPHHLVTLPIRPFQALALQACHIAALPGSHSAGCHKKAPNLPKRNRQT